jgi:hypothetical protein
MIANRSVPSATIIPERPYRHHAQAKRSGARVLQPPADHASWGGTLR